MSVSASRRLLVFGASGYVGSNILAAVECLNSRQQAGVTVLAASRQARPAQPSLPSVQWVAADISSPDSYRSYLEQVDGVISCVGGFGSNAYMERVCGDATVTASAAARALPNVKFFGFVSAHSYAGRPSFALPGYFAGKTKAENAIVADFGLDRSLILRCPLIHGAGHPLLPRQLLGRATQAIGTLPIARSAVQSLPWLDAFLTPAVPVSCVADLMVRSFVDGTPRGRLDVYEMLDAC